MRHCLTLDLKNDPELIEEYKKWHSPENVWKEIMEGIRKVGILEMEIFLWQNRMFMIIETEDDFNWDEQMEKLSKLPRQAEWEAFMDKFQKRLVEGSDVKWQKMDPIFKLTDCI
jgi:L-rhamnose mutarotase